MLQKLILLIKKIELKFTRGRKVKVKGYKKAIITLKKRSKYRSNYRYIKNVIKNF